MNNDLFFSSKSDDWSTPPPIFQGAGRGTSLRPGRMRNGREPQVPPIFQQGAGRPAAELGRMQGLLQPAVQPNKNVGRKGVPRRNAGRHTGRLAHPGADRYPILSRFYFASGGGALHQGKAQVWRPEERRTVPEHGRDIQRTKDNLIK